MLWAREHVKEGAGLLTWAGLARVVPGRRHDTRAQLAAGSEDAVVAREVRARRRDERGELSQKLDPREHHLGAAVQGALELVAEAFVGELAQAAVRHRAACAVVTQALEAAPVPGGDARRSVQREAVDSRAKGLVRRWRERERSLAALARRVQQRGVELIEQRRVVERVGELYKDTGAPSDEAAARRP